MPFQSEKQRRYLWANEPEIARDWTETYGSRIDNNTGGIMRLAFDNGGEVVDTNNLPYEASPYSNKYTEEEFNEIFGKETTGIGEKIGSGLETLKEKVTGGVDYMKELPGMAMGALTGIPGLSFLMQGFKGPQLTQAQKNMNQQFFDQYNVSIDPITGRMVGGPFAGKNAPGTSAFGSKDIDQMATKWLNKYGHTAPIEKVHQMSALAGKDTPTPGQNQGMPQSGGWSGADWGSDEGEFAGLNQGGRVGLAQGNPHLDPGQSQGMSPGEAQARGLGPQHHGSTTSGNLHAGNVGTGEGLGAYQDNIMLGGLGIKPELKTNLIDTGIGGLKSILPFLGKKGNIIGGALSIYDLINKEPDIDDIVLQTDEETTDDETVQEKLAKKITNMDDFIAKQKLKKQANIFKELGLD
jgi:hypothetical protein